MNEWLLAVPGVMAYFVIVGAGYRMAEVKHRRSCPDCGDAVGSITSKSCGDVEVGWGLAGLFWPFVLPALLGGKGGKAVAELETREERKILKEIRIAEHRMKLAQVAEAGALALGRAHSANEENNPLSLSPGRGPSLSDILAETERYETYPTTGSRGPR